MFLNSLKRNFLPKIFARPFSSQSGFYSSLMLTPEQKQLRLAIQKFAQEEVQPIAYQVDRDDKFPRQLWPKLGDLGLLGITAPPQYGGTGLTYFEHCIAMQELSKASGSVALSYGAHSNLMVNQMVLNANEEQKKKYLPKLCSGEYVGALAMSQVGAGSDVLGSMKTNAKYDSSKKKWIMNGGKMWITNASQADALIVYARTPKNQGDRTMTAFIVEKQMKGFTIAQKLDKLGMRGSPTCEIVLDNVQIPQENILGGVGNGIRVLMSGLNSERLVLAAGPIGLMQACIDLTMNYITQRQQFGKKVGEFQLMQGKVADMYVRLQTTRSFVYNLARQASDTSEGAQKVGNKECAAAILYAAQTGTQMALQTIQALGGNGYTNEYPAGRFLRDAKLYQIGAGTSQIRRLIIGRELFKQFS